MSRLPFELTVFDKNYVRRGPLGAPKSLSGEVVFNAPGSLEFALSSDHPRVSALSERGARVVCRYRPTGAIDRLLISGRVHEVAGSGPRRAAVRTFTVADDWTVLSDEIQCWPNPTGTINQQGDEDAYFTRTGPAETVLKQILAPNVTRQGTALTIPATSGRGLTITGMVRFHPITERLWPAFEQAGLGVRVVQVGGQRVLDVYEPVTYSRVLTQDSGIVVDGSWSISAPTVTRVTILAGGEGTARVVRQKVDAALEAEWGVILPAVRDARDIPADDPNLEALLTARMDETLEEGAPKASLKCELTETEQFRFGAAFDVGDRVSIRLSDAPVITDYVRSVGFSWTPESGVEITPHVGEWSDLADAPLIAQVSALTRAVGNLERR